MTLWEALYRLVSYFTSTFGCGVELEHLIWMSG